MKANLQVTWRDKLAAILCALLVCLTGSAAWLIHPALGFVCALGISVSILVLFSVSCARRVIAHINTSGAQTEALISVSQTLKLDAPLPAMTSWAITPDVARLLIELIRDHQPRIIVECGAGASTIVNARMLQLQGNGKVYSIESFENSIEFVRKNLERHRLEEFVELIYAPLREQTLGGEKQSWYDLDKIPEIKDIDMLFVDGPPQFGMPKGTRTRQYALPYFFSKMKKGAIVILDDGARIAERETAQHWANEFDVKAEFLDGFAKGVWLLTVQ